MFPIFLKIAEIKMTDVTQPKLDDTPPLPKPAPELPDDVSEVFSNVTDEKLFVPDDKPCMTTEQPTVRYLIERSQIDMNKVAERIDRVE